MPRLTIVTLPEPKLRERSKEIDPADLKSPAFQRWIDDLIETMHLADGVGIAAPQVGRQIRLFVAMDGNAPHVVVNPAVAGKSWRREDGEEGCLSVPGKYGIVSRFRSFTVKGLGRNGEHIRLEAKGFFARVLQHELDHLDGVLFVDRAKKVINIQL